MTITVTRSPAPASDPSSVDNPLQSIDYFIEEIKNYKSADIRWLAQILRPKIEFTEDTRFMVDNAVAPITLTDTAKKITIQFDKYNSDDIELFPGIISPAINPQQLGELWRLEADVSMVKTVGTGLDALAAWIELDGVEQARRIFHVDENGGSCHIACIAEPLTKNAQEVSVWVDRLSGTDTFQTDTGKCALQMTRLKRVAV